MHFSTLPTQATSHIPYVWKIQHRVSVNGHFAHVHDRQMQKFRYKWWPPLANGDKPYKQKLKM